MKKVTINEVKDAVSRLVDEVREQASCLDVSIDISNVKYKELKSAIEDEYRCGAEGPIDDILTDLGDSIGLDVFGIIQD